MQPYRSLAASVIWQAVEDAVLAKKYNRRDEAIGWIASESDAPCSFVWWCLVCGMDPINIRRVVDRHWRELAINIERGLSIWQEVDDEQGAGR